MSQVEPVLQLPAIPAQPSVLPPTSAALVPAWQTEWVNYRWVVEQHAEAACRAEQANMRAALYMAGNMVVEGVERALTAPRRVSKAEVVLACIKAVPPTIGATELTHSRQVKAVADELWKLMQADPAINPPPAPAPAT